MYCYEVEFIISTYLFNYGFTRHKYCTMRIDITPDSSELEQSVKKLLSLTYSGYKIRIKSIQEINSKVSRKLTEAR